MLFTYTWVSVLQTLREQQPGTVLRLRKHLFLPPEDAGATRSLGLPLGQRADFRWRLGDCSGLHVRDFGSHYEAHLDQVDPSCNFVDHLREDAPEAYVAGGAVLGGLLGILLGRSAEATAAGMGIGAALAALTLPKKPGAK